jgi:hypothetical protein
VEKAFGDRARVCGRVGMDGQDVAPQTASSIARSLSILLIARSTFSTRPSTSAKKLPYCKTLPSYHACMTRSLRARSPAISASCASCMASTPFIRGSSEASSALRVGSGTGVSDVTEVRADDVDGKDAAKERTVARTASGESWLGTVPGSAG